MPVIIVQIVFFMHRQIEYISAPRCITTDAGECIQRLRRLPPETHRPDRQSFTVHLLIK